MARAPFRSIAPAATTLREVAEVLAGAMQGKINATGDVTLNTATTTAILDSRISPQSVLVFNAQSSSGATALAGLWVSAVGRGTATLNHATGHGGEVLSYAVIG